jgi:hypothetical protein
MAKSTSSLEEVPPESSPQPRAPKARKRRAPVPANANAALARVPSSSVKPMLIGVGVGAALGAAALLVGSQLQAGRPRRSSGPTITGMLAKAALLAVANAVAQRAVRMAADKAALTVADAWNPLETFRAFKAR